jgi:putative membrane-bound dehydrogenase-like protein
VTFFGRLRNLPAPFFVRTRHFRTMRPALFPIIAFIGAVALADEPSIRPDEVRRVPPTEPNKAVATCAVRTGFRLELMVAEPLVVDPVAMAFDENGRLYVVEMRDYSERRDEKLGRVKLLEDTDNDGRYDKAWIFVDELPWPTGITVWDGGVFVMASPDLMYFKDMDGDRKADVHAMVFTGFGNLAPKLNVQALPNSLQWGPDQRIHCALGGNPGNIHNFARFKSPKIELRGQDFSFDPRLMDLRPENGGGQFGMTFDEAGRKYVCSNSRHLVQVMFEDRVGSQVLDYPLPAPGVDIAADGPQAEVFRRSPDEWWRVIRTKWRVAGTVKGPIEGGGRSSGYFTSASGVTIYRGDAWPAEYRGDVFVNDCGSNLIHHKKLSGDLLRVGKRAAGEEKSEFVASTDNWFRPVTLANAPDGTLWFADMYRETIEHPWSLPESLKSNLDLNSGNDRGRLYRIVSTTTSANRPAPKLGDAGTKELAALLEHPNGWHRDTAARLLHERQDPAAAEPVKAVATGSKLPAARLLALHVLRGLNALDPALLTGALKDSDSDVRAGAFRLCGIMNVNESQFAALAKDPSAHVRSEVAWALVGRATSDRVSILVDLLERADEVWLRHAGLAAAGPDLEEVLGKLAEKKSPHLATLREQLASKSAQAVTLPQFGTPLARKEAVATYAPALTLPGDPEKGRLTFGARCMICHRFGGVGIGVGPDLDASRIAGREKVLGNILEPSREVTAGYPLGIVETTKKEVISGVIASESAAGVVLRLAGGADRFVRKADIAKVDRPARSLMPDGIEAGLSPQEVADLLEFLTKAAK